MFRTHSKQCVRSHTSARGLFWSAALLLIAGATQAAMRDLPARVLWLREDWVYVGASDSTALAPAMALEFARGKKRLATARVVRMLDPHLALARLDTGSLARERKLDRVTVRGEAAPIARVAIVRVGLPGPRRVNLLFRCAETSVQTRFAGTDYMVEGVPGHGLRLRRASDADGGVPAAPDTIDVRFFSDAADEEIAIERGELDVAVFWPGELSPRMRADERWRDFGRGLRATGVLAALLPARDTLGIPDAAPAALNREAFAGDLLPWSELEPTATPSATAPVGWQVDPALPGAQFLERILGRASRPSATRLARLTWLDVPVAARDAVQATWRKPGVELLFAIRCPVLVTPQLRPGFATMGGADAFANLLRCEVGTP